MNSSRENLSEVTLPDFGPGWVGLGFGFSLGLVLGDFVLPRRDRFTYFLGASLLVTPHGGWGGRGGLDPISVCKGPGALHHICLYIA